MKQCLLCGAGTEFTVKVHKYGVWIIRSFRYMGSGYVWLYCTCSLVCTLQKITVCDSTLHSTFLRLMIQKRFRLECGESTGLAQWGFSYMEMELCNSHLVSRSTWISWSCNQLQLVLAQSNNMNCIPLHGDVYHTKYSWNVHTVLAN